MNSLYFFMYDKEEEKFKPSVRISLDDLINSMEKYLDYQNVTVVFTTKLLLNLKAIYDDKETIGIFTSDSEKTFISEERDISGKKFNIMLSAVDLNGIIVVIYTDENDKKRYEIITNSLDMALKLFDTVQYSLTIRSTGYFELCNRINLLREMKKGEE